MAAAWDLEDALKFLDEAHRSTGSAVDSLEQVSRRMCEQALDVYTQLDDIRMRVRRASDALESV